MTLACFGSSERFLMNSQRIGAETDKQHLVDAPVHCQKRAHLANGDARGPVHRKPVRAGADGRKRDGLDAVLDGDPQRTAITGRKQLVLICVAAFPDRADRVNDVLCF